MRFGKREISIADSTSVAPNVPRNCVKQAFQRKVNLLPKRPIRRIGTSRLTHQPHRHAFNRQASRRTKQEIVFLDGNGQLLLFPHFFFFMTLKKLSDFHETLHALHNTAAFSLFKIEKKTHQIQADEK